jgi:REP element-mobilizing transposase RayT
MPAKNRLKQYVKDSYYHIYNRGVEKRLIFLDAQDYGVFLSYLKEYLTPKNELELRQKLSDPNTSYKEKDKILKLLRMNNFYGEIILLAYCLMPNHFHFFIKQKSALSIDKFMNSLGTRYTMYFNRKYKRVGSLYQAVYKAVLVENEAQFIYLSKYIHKQALALQGLALQEGQPCSYVEYLGIRKTEWVIPEEVLGYFSKTNPTLSYKSFVLEQDDYSNIQNILFEEDSILED